MAQLPARKVTGDSLTAAEVNGLLDHTAGWINVKTYGAIGDGSTNDRAAIQAAIDAAGSGSTVFFPPGTYSLSGFHASGLHSNILQVFKSNITFAGAGASSIIKLASGAYTDSAFNVFSNFDNATPASFGTYSGIAFRDLTFDINGANNTYAYGSGPRVVIQFGDTSNATVERCTFDNLDVSNAVYVGRPLRGARGFTARGNKFLDPTDGNSGNVDHSSIYVLADASVVDGNQFLNTTSRGRVVSTATELHASDSTFSNNVISGYRQAVYLVSYDVEHTQPVTGQVVTGNVARDLNAFFGTMWGFSTTDTLERVVISNNSVSLTPTTAGMDSSANVIGTTSLGHFKKVAISGNVFSTDGGSLYSGGDGLATYGTLTDWTIDGNRWRGFRYAMRFLVAEAVDRNITNLAITNNDLVECGDADLVIYADISAGTTDAISGLRVVGNTFTNATPQARPLLFAADTQSNYFFSGNKTINYAPGTRLATFLGGVPSNLTYEVAPAISADRGDASVTLNWGKDEPVQRFATALTANRTVTLSTSYVGAGASFRIVRTGLGAFTLDVGGLKTIPNSTAAFVDVTYSGSAWILTGYGAL